jgi:hypothetical protein
MIGSLKLAVVLVSLWNAAGSSQPGGSACRLGEVSAAYDYAKCIESCDMQYKACIDRGNEVQYCSDHHDKCRKDCLEH